MAEPAHDTDGNDRQEGAWTMGRGRVGSRWRWALASPLIALVGLQGCGSSSVQANPAIAALVGDWQATSFVVTKVADPSVHPDLIQLGATFTLNVQPSGQYTAILAYNGQPQTEIGELSVSGNSITLTPSNVTGGTSTTGTYQVSGDHLTLDGDTEFPFDLNGTAEPATVHIEFVKK